jgi:hypothetical protein
MTVHIRNLLRSDHFRAAFALSILLIIFYRDVIFGGKTFLMENTVNGTMSIGQGGGPYNYPSQNNGLAPATVTDAGAIAWGYEPSTKLTRDLLWHWTLPLWKNNVGLGSPLLADGMSDSLEPLMILSYLIPDRWWPWSIDLLVLLRFFLGGWFTYLFARRVGIGFFPSLFAGTAFMLSYQIVVFGNSPQLAPQILTPLLLYVLDYVAIKPSLRSLTGASLVIAWVICSGLPEASFLALMMGGFWYSYRSFWQIKEYGYRLSAWQTQIGWGAATAIGGAALSAWFWMPLVENISLSVSNHPVGSGSGTFSPISFTLAMIPPLETIIKTPNFRVVVLTLAIAAALSIPTMGKKMAACAFFLGFCLFFGSGLYGIPPFKWFGYLPGYSQTTNVHYLISSLTLSLILLASFGLDYLSKSVRKIYPLLLSCLIQAGVVGYYLGLNHLVVNYSRQRVIVSMVITGMVWLAICGIALLLAVLKKNQYMPVLILALFFVEVLVVHRNIVRPVRYDPYTEPPFVSFLLKTPEPFRILGLNDVLIPNIAMAYGIDDLRYLDAIEPARRHLFMKKLIAPGKSMDRISGFETPLFMGRILDLLNIRYVLSPIDLQVDGGIRLGEKYQLVYDSEIKIYENLNALPRAFMLFSAKQAGDGNDALTLLADPGFDPLSTAVVESAFWNQQLEELTDAVPEKWKAAQVTNRTANSLEVHTDSTKPCILVVSETYFPGWKAYLDGKPANIFPTDEMLRGVYLPAGSHHVTFVYQPLSFTIGLGISLVTFLIFLIYSSCRH